jgi:hypothetical protein
MSMAEHPPFNHGDILAWQGAPVLVLSTPWIEERGAHFHHKWVARVTYLRKFENLTCEAGQVLPSFNIEGKEPWTNVLTDDEFALAARMLLNV